MLKLVAEVDGNCLCIHREDFINLMESPCFFIKLTDVDFKGLRALGWKPERTPTPSGGEQWKGI